MFLKRRLKLKATKEMIEQSKLWEEGKEDLELVKKLYEEIIEQAKKKGFNGICDIDDGTEESLCYVYDNEEHKRLACDGKTDDFSCVGYPLALIKVLESKLNNEHSPF